VVNVLSFKPIQEIPTSRLCPGLLKILWVSRNWNAMEFRMRIESPTQPNRTMQSSASWVSSPTPEPTPSTVLCTQSCYA